MTAAAAIRLDDLTLGYDRHPAIHHLSGSFGPGSLTAVVGPNGAGKTTLLKAIVGLLRPLAGRIDLGAVRRDQIAYLPQQADIDRSFPISVLDTVQLGHWGRIGVFGRISPAMRAAAANALDAVGLTGFEQRPIGSLSAGQFQRVLFARTLLQDCPVILLDEPFTAIDAHTAQDLLALVHRWHGEQRTIVMVSHDLEQVRGHFPQTLLVAREQIGWGPTPEILTAVNLQRAGAMLERWKQNPEICGRSSA
ncbi:MAG TPA: metal ABC transporter ATP-binding protein [Candidatus Angelobacter sp.]|nr:metal ABC transporter ATP-binding protein [Candidatus Angelobacter sp.]